MFSNLSSSSISLATVTPSLVIVGAPNFLSRTTFLPFGPRVTFTASARVFTPRRRGSRALVSNCSCFGMVVDSSVGESLLDDAVDVAFGHDEVLLVRDLHLGAGVLA